MNNRKPIPRSELLYPHIVRKSGKDSFFVVNTATPNVDVIGLFKSHEDALEHAKELNQAYLHATGWFVRDQAVHQDRGDFRVPLVPLAIVVLSLVLLLHLVERIPL
jgi:hypothetical protein